MAGDPPGAVPGRHTEELPALRGRPSHLPPDDPAEAPAGAVPGADPGPPTAATTPAQPAPPRVSEVAIGAEQVAEPWYQETAARPGFRARFGVVYDVDGPRVRLGIGWALLVGASIVYGPARLGALAVLFGAAAGWAALQTLTAWRPDGRPLDRWAAAAGAAVLPLATGAFGARATGGALIGVAGLALLIGWSADHDWASATARAGRLVASAVWVGLAGAGVVLTLRYEIGAAITLLILVSVYEASDYIVGSGASNRIEGPLAGIVSIAVVASIVAFLQVPPFEGLDALWFGGLAAVLCPVGQLVASGLLPRPDAHAPALRRLDSLLVLAPIWAWLVGWVLVHQR